MATSFPPSCPQTPRNAGVSQSTVTGNVAAASSAVSEDCLFLDIYAPSNATNLPVLVWIHGGGYGAGNGRAAMDTLVAANDNGFIGVSKYFSLTKWNSRILSSLPTSGTIQIGCFWLSELR